jgi:DNA-binding response OmpR family regulator
MLAHTSHRVDLPNAPSEAAQTPSGPARLTRKESQLLSVLQQNAGRCLPRGYLLETIWGYRNGTRTRTLYVHIQRLRHKLGPEEAARILTVLRSGYAWTGGPGERHNLQ